MVAAARMPGRGRSGGFSREERVARSAGRKRGAAGAAALAGFTAWPPGWAAGGAGGGAGAVFRADGGKDLYYELGFDFFPEVFSWWDKHMGGSRPGSPDSGRGTPNFPEFDERPLKGTERPRGQRGPAPATPHPDTKLPAAADEYRASGLVFFYQLMRDGLSSALRWVPFPGLRRYDAAGAKGATGPLPLPAPAADSGATPGDMHWAAAFVSVLMHACEEAAAVKSSRWLARAYQLFDEVDTHCPPATPEQREALHVAVAARILQEMACAKVVSEDLTPADVRNLIEWHLAETARRRGEKREPAVLVPGDAGRRAGGGAGGGTAVSFGAGASQLSPAQTAEKVAGGGGGGGLQNPSRSALRADSTRIPDGGSDGFSRPSTPSDFSPKSAPPLPTVDELFYLRLLKSLKDAPELRAEGKVGGAAADQAYAESHCAYMQRLQTALNGFVPPVRKWGEPAEGAYPFHRPEEMPKRKVAHSAAARAAAARRGGAGGRSPPDTAAASEREMAAVYAATVESPLNRAAVDRLAREGALAEAVAAAERRGHSRPESRAESGESRPESGISSRPESRRESQLSSRSSSRVSSRPSTRLPSRPPSPDGPSTSEASASPPLRAATWQAPLPGDPPRPRRPLSPASKAAAVEYARKTGLCPFGHTGTPPKAAPSLPAATSPQPAAASPQPAAASPLPAAAPSQPQPEALPALPPLTSSTGRPADPHCFPKTGARPALPAAAHPAAPRLPRPTAAALSEKTPAPPPATWRKPRSAHSAAGEESRTGSMH